jgi:Tol biopolymer transport system component
LSPNQKWLVITERDLDYTTLAELAEPRLMLAGRRFKQFPDTRIENVGITRLTLRSIDGATERTLVPPGEGRIDSVTWVRDSSTGGELAYTVIQNGAMAVHLYDAATGVDRRLATPGLTGKIDALSFTRDGSQLAFTAATRDAVTLWLADTRQATARPVPGLSLNHVNGGFDWTRGSLRTY